MATRETLSSIDTAWLRMDRPANLMMICGIMILDGRLELQSFKDVVRQRMLSFHRFRQRVVEANGASYWEDDPDFDIDWHVRRIVVAPAGGDKELAGLLGELASTPLDRARPMWQFHLLDIGRNASALVLRIHHCYGDGFALSHVVASMTDLDPGRPRSTPEDVGNGQDNRAAWERVFGPVSEAVGDALHMTMAAVDTGYRWLVQPGLALAYGMTGFDILRAAAYIANMKPDAPTRFKGQLGGIKRVAWTEPLSLFDVKAVSQAFGCSLNDVLLACVTGALRRYLQEQGDAVDEAEVRALVPVNMRPPGPVTELGNRFSLVFLTLPLGVEERIKRVREIKRRMDELKKSQQPLVALGILMGMGVLPEMLKENVLETLAANASMVITNVRSAPEPRYIAGKRIARQIFWVPQSGGIGLGISILTYAGQVDFGIVADARRIPDPAAIVQGFRDEFENLLYDALMMPWPQDAEKHAAIGG